MLHLKFFLIIVSHSTQLLIDGIYLKFFSIERKDKLCEHLHSQKCFSVIIHITQFTLYCIYCSVGLNDGKFRVRFPFFHCSLNFPQSSSH
jgi:hypothetical protein